MPRSRSGPRAFQTPAYVSAVALLVAAPLASCTQEGAIDWAVGPAPGAGVVAYEATLRRGGCASGDVVYSATRRRGEASAIAVPPALEAGSWGFAARARDGACQWVAEGCEERTLPSNEAVAITLAPITPEPACDADACVGGFCEGLDFGPGLPPPPPRLAWPPNGSSTGSARAPASAAPRLVWRASPTADTYELEVSGPCEVAVAECDFGGAARQSTPATEQTAAVTLADPVRGDRRAWRVRGCNAEGCGPWSAARALLVGRQPGDVDGDGYADALLAAPATAPGLVELAPGAETPADVRTPIATAQVDNVRRGSALTLVDADGDGYGDAFVGAPFDDAGGRDAGALIRHAGGAAGLGPELSVALGALGGASSTAGASVAVVGDVNGDGFLDLAVGAPQAGAGALAVLLGGPGGPTLAAVLQAPADASAQARFGAAIAGADLDGDGAAELLVGSPEHDDGLGAPAAGRVYVYRGSAAGLVATPALVLESEGGAGARFGAALVALADFDGDRLGDVAVGSPDESGGAVYLYGGDAARLLRASPVRLVAGANAGFGFALASGDLDADGRSDLVVGGPDFMPGALATGAAFVYLGDVDAPSTPDRILDRAPDGARLGASLGCVGDVDGDGRDDLFVGAPGEGAAYLHLGAATLPALTPTVRYAGEGPGFAEAISSSAAR